MNLQKMLAMISPLCKQTDCNMYCNLTHLLHVGTADKEYTARIPNPAVESDLLERVHSWIKAGATTDDIIERLKLETVPVGL